MSTGLKAPLAEKLASVEIKINMVTWRNSKQAEKNYLNCPNRYNGKSKYVPRTGILILNILFLLVPNYLGSCLLFNEF